MTVTEQKIREQYDRVLAGVASREAVSKWAEEVQHAVDDRTVRFVPSAKEERLWDAICFLLMVDTVSLAEDYLYSAEDIRLNRP